MEQIDAALQERIYLAVAQIPVGAVSSYGDVAAVVGGCTARAVGFALGALPAGRTIPWQRVVARDGAISTRGLAQRALLEGEGVGFDDAGRAIIARHRWRGPAAAWASANGFCVLPERADGEQLSLF